LLDDLAGGPADNLLNCPPLSTPVSASRLHCKENISEVGTNVRCKSTGARDKKRAGVARAAHAGRLSPLFSAN
jgi:hypothetical protein